MKRIILPLLPARLLGLHGEENRIYEKSLSYLKSDSALDQQLSHLETTMDLVWWHVQEHEHRSDDELTLQFIGIHLFDDLAASLKLMLFGYYRQSYTLQREAVEIKFLLDYFRTSPEDISRWKLKGDEHSSFYPRAVRESIDRRDGFLQKKRSKEYTLFSKHTSHITYKANKLVALNDRGLIGPFFEEKQLKHCFEELTKQAIQATLFFSSNFNITHPELITLKKEFLEGCTVWYEKVFGELPEQTTDKLRGIGVSPEGTA